MGPVVKNTMGIANVPSSFKKPKWISLLTQKGGGGGEQNSKVPPPLMITLDRTLPDISHMNINFVDPLLQWVVCFVYMQDLWEGGIHPLGVLKCSSDYFEAN